MDQNIMSRMDDLKYEMGLHYDYVSEKVIEYTSALYELSENVSKEQQIGLCRDLLKEVQGTVYMKIWLYSFSVELTKDSAILTEFLEWLLEVPQLKMHTLYFMYQQILTEMFFFKALVNDRNRILCWKLWSRVFNLFKIEMAEELHKIEFKDRNQNLAVVITDQFLGVQHGPTKTALDRCYTLMHQMGKQVLLINTAEMNSLVGEIPLFRIRAGSYNENIKDESYMEWRGAKIPYFQCDYNMPDVDILKYLIKVLYDMKPGIVVDIGGGGVFAGLVNEMIPVLEVPLTSSNIFLTISDYQIVPPQEMDRQKHLLTEIGKKPDHAIVGRFTFSLKEQTEKVSRKELGLPENAFLLCVIGGRLREEVTGDFIRMLEKVLSDYVQIVFIGSMPTYPQLCQEYSWLEKYSYYLGFADDILSRVELCDLYVNPERRGGGTSSVEAMFKGLPVVTTEYGDVAGIVGSAFICTDYEEMAELIRRYAKEKEFYEKQSAAAREVARQHLDTEVEFERCVNIYIERMKSK